MKILVDIDALQSQGLVTQETAALLRDHALRDTGSTAINLLLAFGAIGVAAGLGALTQSISLAAVMGAGLILGGYVARRQAQVMWGKLGSIWMIVGALVLCGSLGALIGHPMIGAVLAAIILAAVAFLASSHLLAALVPLVLESAIGGSTGYWSACYFIAICEPTLTIILFAGLAYGAWMLNISLTQTAQALTLTFTRMCIILVNFGFWIGSLWGDTPGHLWRDPEGFNWGAGGQQIPEIAFVLGWAAALLAAGWWGAKNGRRFLVNTVAVFGAIHLYTQWFERFGADPISVIIGGVATIAIGLALWNYNRQAIASPPLRSA